MPTVAVIGAGPAGLFAAQCLAEAGFAVTVYEQKRSAARKFLIAGRGGLNISHNEALDKMLNRYDQPQLFLPLLQQFAAPQIISWMQQLGFEHKVGSSGRIFPYDMQALPLLKAWLAKLKQLGVQFCYQHQWLGWNKHNQQLLLNKQVSPATQIAAHFDYVILALGGRSWPHLGSDGKGVEWLLTQNIAVTPFTASNVGVKVNWSSVLKAKANGQALKSVQATIHEHHAIADCNITPYGLEGGLIYALGRHIHNEQPTTLQLDLLPQISHTQIVDKLNKATGSIHNKWRKIGLSPAKIDVLREVLAKQDWQNNLKVAHAIKNAQLTILQKQPIEEAISSAGGVSSQALNANLSLKQHPNVFCCGEMLDWDAPTGGYLLTGCFSTAYHVAQQIIQHHTNQPY